MKNLILLILIFTFIFSGCASLTIEKEIQECKKLPEVGNFWNGKYTMKIYPQDNCLTELALKYNDSDFCKQVNDVSVGGYISINDMKAYCYKQVAIKLFDPKVCFNIIKDSKDISIFESVDYKNCILKSGGYNLSTCDSFAYTTQIRDECINDVAFSQLNQTYCLKINNSKRQAYCYNSIVEQINIRKRTEKYLNLTN